MSSKGRKAVNKACREGRMRFIEPSRRDKPQHRRNAFSGYDHMAKQLFPELFRPPKHETLALMCAECKGINPFVLLLEAPPAACRHCGAALMKDAGPTTGEAVTG